MQINYLAIILATVAQFIVGAIWYGALFGKLWGKIHCFDQLSKEKQKEMMSKMGPYYALQAFVTLITAIVFWLFVHYTGWNPFGLAGFFWLGFFVPTQVSGVIFGGTESKWIVTKIAVQAGASLLCLEAAAVVFHFLA